ncbi:MAG: DUF4367 domain-containing protein [Anaerovoracaceae bacterium]
MNSKREAKKILKLYAKKLYASRMDYVNSFEKNSPGFVHRINYRLIMKRCIVTILILTLIFSMLVVGAGALGINLFGFSLLQEKTHTEVSGSKEPNRDNQQPVFYEPEFIPDSYILISIDDFANIDRTYVYKNDKENCLYINESIGENPNTSIDNNDCQIRKEVIDEMEVYIYDYHAEDVDDIYFLEKQGTFISIQGRISDTTLKQIIHGLN